MRGQHSRGAATAERFVVERTLGRGGMATVYLARDRELDRPVALKVLAEHYADDPGFRDRFLREARLAAKLVHPNVVQVYDVGEDERGPFIVMEYVDGDTLADELRRRGRLPPADVVAIGIQLCSALEAAHNERLVHRDIKPQNVLLRPSGQVKLADFGIARSLAGTRHTEVGTVLGTAAYLAPEQARGEPVTGAADIYSLGVVLYELLTGQTPISADTLSELISKRERGAFPPPSELAPVPAELEAVVLRCLALRPDYRPVSAAALARDLAASIDEPPTEPLPVDGGLRATEVLPATVETRPLHPASKRARWITGRRLFAAVGAAALLALAATIAAVLADSDAHHGAAKSSTRPDARAAPATPPATTTVPAKTTTAPPRTTLTAPGALAALVGDVAAGVAAGTLDPGSGQAISNQAEQAIADEATGRPNQAANDLQQAAMQIANGVQNGKTTSTEGAKLESDLTRLATTLGLRAASAPPAIQPPPAHGPGGPHGPGHGHGHGG